MSRKKHEIVIKSILCKEKGERTGDDLYIKYEADGGVQHRFPSSRSGAPDMKPGDTWNLDFPIDFNERVVVALYDRDVGNNDYLGTHTFRAAEDGKVENITYNERDGRYQMFVEHLK